MPGGPAAVITAAVLAAGKCAYLLTDRTLRVIDAAPGAAALLGLDREPLGETTPDLIPELLGSEATLAELLAGTRSGFELALVNRETPGGETCYLTLIALPYRDEAGNIAGLVQIVQDVTVHGQAEQRIVQQRNELRLLQDQLARQSAELAAANAELRRADQLKSQFVAVAAHELRTPLTSMLGYVDLVLEGAFGRCLPKQREALEIVRSTTLQLATIVSDLLDLTAIQAGQVELVLRPLDLWPAVARVCAELRPQAEARRQTLDLATAPELPAVLGDPPRVAQIARNLIGNAIKYTPDGGQIAVSLAMVRDSAEVQLTVADSGVGISDEDQQQVFQQFFRARSGRALGATGAGLGLHITRDLVELHGGRIWFESQLGHGSTFHVAFVRASGG